MLKAPFLLRSSNKLIKNLLCPFGNHKKVELFFFFRPSFEGCNMKHLCKGKQAKQNNLDWTSKGLKGFSPAKHMETCEGLCSFALTGTAPKSHLAGRTDAVTHLEAQTQISTCVQSPGSQRGTPGLAPKPGIPLGARVSPAAPHSGGDFQSPLPVPRCSSWAVSRRALSSTCPVLVPGAQAGKGKVLGLFSPREQFLPVSNRHAFGGCSAAL